MANWKKERYVRNRMEKTFILFFFEKGYNGGYDKMELQE